MNILPTLLLASFIIIMIMTMYFSTNKVHSVLGNYYTKKNTKKYSSGKKPKEPEPKYGESTGFLQVYTQPSSSPRPRRRRRRRARVNAIRAGDRTRRRLRRGEASNKGIPGRSYGGPWNEKLGPTRGNNDENALEDTWENAADTVDTVAAENALEDTWEDEGDDAADAVDENALEDTWEEEEDADDDQGDVAAATDAGVCDENCMEDAWEDLEEGFAVSSLGRLPRPGRIIAP